MNNRPLDDTILWTDHFSSGEQDSFVPSQFFSAGLCGNQDLTILQPLGYTGPRLLSGPVITTVETKPSEAQKEQETQIQKLVGKGEDGSTDSEEIGQNKESLEATSTEDTAIEDFDQDCEFVGAAEEDISACPPKKAKPNKIEHKLRYTTMLLKLCGKCLQLLGCG